jgi:predicted transcriptional regulator
VRRLGELEAAVMDAVWVRSGSTTVRDILDDLIGRQLAYTTVMTVMHNLYRKGLLSRVMVGRSWSYAAALSRSEYTAQMMRDVLASGGDQSAALAHFVAGMTPEESEVVRGLLRRRRRAP